MFILRITRISQIQNTELLNIETSSTCNLPMSFKSLNEMGSNHFITFLTDGIIWHSKLPKFG